MRIGRNFPAEFSTITDWPSETLFPYFPGEPNRWKAWISLKFTGPGDGGAGENQVLCDRVILVYQGAE